MLPGSWRAKLWLARDALEKKDLDGAVSQYRQVLEQTDPHDRRTHTNLWRSWKQ